MRCDVYHNGPSEYAYSSFLCRCFEGAIAACAAPMVGVLAQKVFGFTGTASPTGDRESDLAKAQAIGNALLCFMAIPWTLCLIAYSGRFL